MLDLDLGIHGGVTSSLWIMLSNLPVPGVALGVHECDSQRNSPGFEVDQLVQSLSDTRWEDGMAFEYERERRHGSMWR